MTALASALDIPPTSNTTNTNSAPRNSSNRGQIVLQFLERPSPKRRQPTKSWFGTSTAHSNKGNSDDGSAPWETWVLDVTLASPRSESEAVKARRAMETSLLRTAMKIVNIVNRDRGHIPPITTSESNPFPYLVLVNPRSEGWGTRMGIF